MTNFQTPHKHLIILGPQASGKGTQAEMLCQEFGLKHISMGEKLREEVASGSKLGQTLRGFMDRGELVPNEYTLKIALREIQSSPDGFVLDGFPRNDAQAKFLDDHTRIDKVIVLDLNDKVAIERITITSYTINQKKMVFAMRIIYHYIKEQMILLSQS